MDRVANSDLNAYFVADANGQLIRTWMLWRGFQKDQLKDYREGNCETIPQVWCGWTGRRLCKLKFINWPGTCMGCLFL